MQNLVTIQNVRGYVDKTGTAYLNLEDVARGLGFITVATSGNEVIRWKRVEGYLNDLSYTLVCTERKEEFIPENIFYKLCMKANNDTARKFQDLVCDEILPTIRKTGGYIATSEDETDEDIMARALLIAQKTIEKRNQKIQQLESKIEQDKPLVEFANQVSSSSDSILVREFCKILADEKIKIGQNTLYQWFRDNGYIIKNGTEPTQKAINMALFEVIERVIKTPYGDKMTLTTKITGKGQIYFTEKLRKLY